MDLVINLCAEEYKIICPFHNFVNRFGLEYGDEGICGGALYVTG